MKNIKLIVVLVTLILLYFGLDYFGGKSRSKSFRKDLVTIDTAKVNKIKITKDHKTVILDKNSNTWKVNLDGGKKATAKNSHVTSAFRTLLTIKPNRVVAKNDKKWKEYQVDSAGIRVEIFENNKSTLDLIIGKFGVRNQREFYTYVRLSEDKEVYACDNFMGMSFPSTANSFRNSEVIQFKTDSITDISFIFPEDSSFKMTNTEVGWLIEDQKVDSIKVQDFINNLKNTHADDYADELLKNTIGEETYSMLINIKHQTEPIKIVAYKDPDYKWLIYSSYNNETYFADRDGKLVDKIFKGRSYFK